MSPRTTILRGGRVVDPGSSHDGVADLALRQGTIVGLAPSIQDDDAEIIDVSGLVVGPGFVDLHSHCHSVAGHRLQAMDGVTTALDLEAGLMPVRRAYAAAAQEGRPLNYGFSASWGAARAAVLLGLKPEPTLEFTLGVVGDIGWQRSSSADELRCWLDRLEHELEQGALGIGILQGYAPDTRPSEFLEVARLAARLEVPTFTHVRELKERRANAPVDGPEEVVRAAYETGAAMHHCHVNSTSGKHVERVLGTIDEARTQGLSVTSEFYPYGSGSTAIGAAFLEPERLASWGLTPNDVVVLGSGERIADEQRLRALRDTTPEKLCLIEVLDEQDRQELKLLLASVRAPDAVVASDAVPVTWPDGSTDTSEWPLPPGGITHPRTAGTFTKTLRLMVRESTEWSWLEAFRRASYLPARIVDALGDDARRRGHLGAGAVADIVVLDPETLGEAATYEDPTAPAHGVTHLIVSGEFLVANGRLDTQLMPGRPVRGSLR